METSTTVSAVLAQVTCTWAEGQATAVVVHSGGGMLVLEATDPRADLPPIGAPVEVRGQGEPKRGRLAEHGRHGRFLVALGQRPVRRSLRLKVSLPATIRGADLAAPVAVEIVDLTTGGARIRGIELPVGAQVTINFTPPFRDRPVSVRASVAHGTHGATQPWIGVLFRLVALRGGR